MIRRISKNNDLKDLIKSCPSGVIDDITEIRYFISGHPETEIVAAFKKVGNHLEAILPTSDLATLSNGVLMRRALYKVVDAAYPDGQYNLEFVDNLDVWLGDEETEDPFYQSYLTEDDLKTLNGESLVGVGNIDVVNYIPDYYATKSWVSEQGYITSETLPEDIATQGWVSANFLSDTSLTGYATEQWVSEKGYITSTALTGYATESWVESQGYLTSHQDLSAYATKSWVSDQGYLTSVPSGYATEQWVQSQGYITDTGLSGLATQSWVSSNFLSSTALTGYATESWVESQGYLTSHQDLSSYATQSWVSDQGYLTSHQDLSSYATQSWVSSNFLSSTALTGYATEQWVSEKGYITSTALTGYATEQWVSEKGYITSTALTGYATESWVESQGYLTSHQDLSAYATKSWVSVNYLEESKVWCGTQAQWDKLTSEQKTSYKIALVTL